MSRAPESRSAVALSTVEPGADLLEALGRLSGPGEAWLSATGHLEAVELRVAGEEVDQVRALRGRFTLVQLSGPSGGPFAVTLARASDAGFEVMGGEVMRARSAGVTVAIQFAGAAVPLQAGAAATSIAGAPDKSRVRQGTRAEERTPTRIGERSGVPSPWARAAAASAEADQREDEEEVEAATPDAGDLVEHFAFGLCEVLTSDGDRLRIRDVEGPRRIREVALAMLNVAGPTESGGKRLFRLMRRGASA